jgi:hypothetical protein
LRDVALITTCPIRLAEHARIDGALIISTAKDSGLATAHPSARIGDPAGRCDAALRTILMSTTSLALPASLTTSNVAVVAGGDVTLGLDGAGAAKSGHGIAVHAGGRILGNGAQSFRPCPGAADPLLPDLRVISHAMPPLDGWVTPVTKTKDPELPGNRGKRLEFEGARS